MSEIVRKPRGPKPKPPSEVKRNSFTFRMHEIMRTRLLASANKRRRSMSEEVEHRLNNSLEDDERFGDLESQMFGRRVGETITIAAKQILERKRAAGEDLEHAEWWREISDREEVRERVLTVIETDLGKSSRWMMPPPELAEKVRQWIDALPETEVKPSFQDAVLQLLSAGLDASQRKKPQ